ATGHVEVDSIEDLGYRGAATIALANGAERHRRSRRAGRARSSRQIVSSVQHGIAYAYPCRTRAGSMARILTYGSVEAARQMPTTSRTLPPETTHGISIGARGELHRA